MLEKMGKAAKQASWQLGVLGTTQKNSALLLMADLLEAKATTFYRQMSKIWLRLGQPA